MAQQRTAEDINKMLREEVFKGIDLDRVETMSDDERREFTIAQVDRLYSLRDYGDMVGRFGDFFIDSTRKVRKDNPILEQESALNDWYLDVATICHDLCYHNLIDLSLIDERFAQHPMEPEKDYTIDNEPLVEWMQQTPLRHVAAQVARRIIDQEYKRVIHHFDAVQDYYAENCETSVFNESDCNQCNQLVTQVIESISSVRKHQEQGRELGLDDEQMRVVDALWSWVPHDYEPSYVEAAKAICAKVDELLPGKTVIRSQNGFIIFKKMVMPELREIIEQYDLSVDLDDSYNLTIGYLAEWLYVKYMGDAINDEQDDDWE